MKCSNLIENVARRMAKADGHEPDTEVFGGRSYPLMIGDLYVFYAGGLASFRGPIWMCYRGRAAQAVEFVIGEASQ